MNIQIAKQMGVKAYRKGNSSAPGNNNIFMVAVRSLQLTRGQLAAHYVAFTHGWTVAKLADGITDPTSPSVIELDEIMKDS